MDPDLAAFATSSDRPRVKASGPDDLIAVIPYFLGFHPTDSVVVVGLTGAPTTVGLTMRLDLDQAADPRCDLSHVMDAFRRAQVHTVLLFAYAPAAPTPAVDRLLELCASAGLGVDDVYLVHDGRRWSLSCDDQRCCPAEGVGLPDPAGSAAVAAAVTTGMVAAPERAALVAELRPIGGLVASAVEQSVDRHLDRWSAAVVGGGRAATLALAEDDACVEDVMHRRLAGDETPLGVDEASRVLLALQDVIVRDAAMRWYERDEARVAHRLWVELVRLAPDDMVAPAATLAAVTAYCLGDGARAAVALDRALAADPDYRMAVYLDHGLRRCVPPSTVREICSGTMETLEIDRELTG